MLRENKENATFIGLLFLFSIIFLHSVISTTKIMNNIHHVNDVTFVSENIKESVFKYGGIDLWTPYYYSGRPLYAQPEYYFFDLNFLYILLFSDIYIAMNLATISYFFLAGLGMYLLFLNFNGNKFGAFIAAIIYMFNGYMHSFVINGNLNVLAGYSLVPFAFMFFVKTLQSKNKIKNCIYSALFMALQIFAGGTLLIPYEIILFGIYSLFYLFNNDFKKRALNLLFVGILIGIFSFGISAIKLLPGIDFMNLSNRSLGVSYQEYLGEPIQLSNIFHILVSNLFSTGLSASIGIVAFILLLFSLFDIKKRYVMFSLSLAIFSVLMAAKGFVADLFFKLPVYNQLRHIERALFLAAFACSLLAGAGYSVFQEKIKNFLKINKNWITFSLIVLLILVELMFLQRFPNSINITEPTDIEINNFISKDKEMFRTMNLALSSLIGASGYNYLAQLGISDIKGGGGIWFNDYIGYLSIAQQTKPAKLWGILNNKYVISKEELNIKDLKFVDKFAKCEKCLITEVEGPYLYENLEFAPRAYFVDRAVLVIAKNNEADQIIYPIIISNYFDPKKQVIIKGRESLSSYSLEELNNYDALIVSGSLSQSGLSLLKNYAKNNKTVLPDILNNKNSISEDDIKNLFEKLNGNFEEVEITDYKNNQVTYNVNNKKGFLVLSETFANFPGWEAMAKNKKEILKADGIITAVQVSGDREIIFKYKPSSFAKGLWISVISLIFIIIFFIYSYIKKIGGKNQA